MPRFSIIIPTFNAVDTLIETIQSLQAQSFADWEAFIIDDGSSDETVFLADAAAHFDRRIRVLPNIRKGPSAARNFGATIATGDILAFCDADDLWVPEKLEVLDRVFRDTSIDACFAQVGFFDRQLHRSLSTVPEGDLTVPMLLGENPVCTMSNIAVRNSVFEATAGFDMKLVHNEDLEWLIRLVGSGHRVVGLQHTLVYYRTSVTGLSADIGAMRQGRRAALNTARCFGYTATPQDEAVFLRYLARRALRTDAPALQTLMLARDGLRTSLSGWFSPANRGAQTLIAALVAPLIPARLRHALFCS
nr:glycosyltransferase family 2 protein [uncultured Celeribacter sp.]